MFVPWATMLWAAPAWGAGGSDHRTCPTELTGVESAPWRAAVEDLGQMDFQGTDCARIVVDVGVDRTRLSFMTQGGREAVRILSHPAELRPAIEALVVGDSLSIEDTASVPASPPPKQAAIPSQPKQREVHPIQERPAPAPRTGSAYALQAGARVGSQIGGGTRDAILLSPVLAGSAWIGRYPWELGVLGAFEFQYFDLRNHDPEQRESSSVSVGVAVGRRDALDAVDLLTSVRLSVATIESENEKGSGEARGGVAIGVSYPRHRSVRLRADLCAELVAGSNVTSPESPEWAVSSLVGVEIGGG